MKRAGAKNDGAWFRANREIIQLTGADRTDLGTLIAASDHADNAIDALISLQAETGLNNLADTPTSKESWIARMLAKGIPRQIWNGRLSFTTYSRSGEPGDYEYTANYQSQMHYFAKDLRKIVRNYIYARRELKDVFDIVSQGNPGGLPDATLNSPDDIAVGVDP